MMEAGTSYPDKGRKDRCAKVAAEVAYHTVEILNDYTAGTYKPMMAKLSNDTESCLTCHGEAAHNNAKGQMDCLTCHDDHTK
jgi:dihydropteroate synthase